MDEQPAEKVACAGCYVVAVPDEAWAETVGGSSVCPTCKPRHELAAPPKKGS